LATLDTTIPAAPAQQSPDPCAECGAALAADQRYCLSCGARRADPRVAYGELLAERHPAAHGEPEPVLAQPARDWTPMVALGALGGLALVLIIGVLIGKTGFGDAKQAAAPQVIRLGPSAGGATAGTALASTSAGGTFKSDWPSGRSGYTVELGVLPKSGTDAAAVAAAKSDAQAKGAPAVGALDSAAYKSLPGGQYVLYSGVFSTKAQANGALKKLKSKFPSAQVVQVSTEAPKAKADYAGKQSAKLDKKQLEDLNNLSGDEYAKRSRKLPTTTALPGKPPPTDGKAPGGGSGGDTIK
jgi:hypothetical protein